MFQEKEEGRFEGRKTTDLCCEFARFTCEERRVCQCREAPCEESEVGGLKKGTAPQRGHHELKRCGHRAHSETRESTDERIALQPHNTKITHMHIHRTRF